MKILKPWYMKVIAVIVGIPVFLFVLIMTLGIIAVVFNIDTSEAGDSKLASSKSASPPTATPEPPTPTPLPCADLSKSDIVMIWEDFPEQRILFLENTHPFCSADILALSLHYTTIPDNSPEQGREWGLFISLEPGQQGRVRVDDFYDISKISESNCTSFDNLQGCLPTFGSRWRNMPPDHKYTVSIMSAINREH